MTPLEKKNFLQNDLIERMIRIERSVFKDIKGKPFRESSFYKELSIEDKKSFNKYLNDKKKKSFSKLVLLLSPLFAFMLMRFNITGNIIRDSTGVEPYWWGLVALGIFLIIGAFMFTSYLLGRRMERRLKGHEKDLVKRVGKGFGKK
jgi:hypothetical protein